MNCCTKQCNQGRDCPARQPQAAHASTEIGADDYENCFDWLDTAISILTMFAIALLPIALIVSVAS